MMGQAFHFGFQSPLYRKHLGFSAMNVKYARNPAGNVRHIIMSSTPSLFKAEEDEKGVGLRSNTMRNIEKDYKGLVNFCLRGTDTLLSGPSRSKVLNAATNDVFKVLLIGDDGVTDSLLTNFDDYYELVDETPCQLGDPEDGDLSTPELMENACTADRLKAKLYMQLLRRLLVEGDTAYTPIGSIYDIGYKRLLTTLRDAGCRFSVGTRPLPPPGSNICESILDAGSSAPSRTRDLNVISNRVSRAMLYGGRVEKRALADGIERGIPDFVARWGFGDPQAQEVLYLRALALFLREGLVAAEAAIGPATVVPSVPKPDLGVSEVSGPITDPSLGLFVPRFRLFDSYSNAFERVLETCLSEITSRGDVVPQNEDVLQTVIAWEQSLRTNLTEAAWQQHPSELQGKWELVSVMGDGSLEPLMSATDDEYFSNRAVGPGDGPNSPNSSKRGAVGVQVELRADGEMAVFMRGGPANQDSARGVQWRFSPGPAHLDTCKFLISSDTRVNKLVLQFTGFIDRGQRIESRFSGRAIRMTGRVLVLNSDQQVKSSSRFIMAKRS
jgi:hypothetical protein